MNLKIASQFLYMTHWLSTMCHHIGFGYKRLSCSENIFWTKPGRQIHVRMDTRIRRFQHNTPLPPAYYVRYNKTGKRSKTKLHMFRKCYKTTKRHEKCCESLTNIRTHLLKVFLFFLQHFVGHVEYLRIPDKVSIPDFGRPQKWIQHTQFL